MNQESTVYIVRVLLLALILCLPAFADWTREVISGKGGDDDKPRPESLQYFTQYPSLHDASGDFCYLCSEEQRLAAARKEKVRADVSFLGRVNGREIYDILYYFAFDDEQKPRWKSLIVETGPNRYGEILQVHPVVGRVWHSELIKVGKEQLVHAIDDCQRLGCMERFYRIGPDGPVQTADPVSSK